jgi:hypothetical protein
VYIPVLVPVPANTPVDGAPEMVTTSPPHTPVIDTEHPEVEMVGEASGGLTVSV